MSTPSTTTPRTRAARSTKASLPAKSATGAAPTTGAVAEVVCPAAPRRSINGTGAITAPRQHETHGATTPLSGPITNVSQLINGGRNIAKGSAGSFATMEEYTAYLEQLNLGDLRAHARNDAKIVPIDDRPRLIRRLQTAWTATAQRYPGRAGSPTIPGRAPFSQEQIAAQQDLRNKLLRQ